jgi:hypothetical protein
LGTTEGVTAAIFSSGRAREAAIFWRLCGGPRRLSALHCNFRPANRSCFLPAFMYGQISFRTDLRIIFAPKVVNLLVDF